MIYEFNYIYEVYKLVKIYEIISRKLIKRDYYFYY